MLGHMKKQTITDYVEILFRIPSKNLNKVKRSMASYGAEEIDKTLPWREAFPNYNASVALRGARNRENLTQRELARQLKISQTHISEMEHGKRPIGKDMAKRLAGILHVDYRVFL